jgi:hypothetical protein
MQDALMESIEEYRTVTQKYSTQCIDPENEFGRMEIIVAESQGTMAESTNDWRRKNGT